MIEEDFYPHQKILKRSMVIMVVLILQPNRPDRFYLRSISIKLGRNFLFDTRLDGNEQKKLYISDNSVLAEVNLITEKISMPRNMKSVAFSDFQYCISV